MGLDTSKLNLQGIGSLSADATMVSGTNPSDSFNVTIKVDDANQNFTSEVLTLENVSSISGTVTFKLTSNPGFQINSSMFVEAEPSSYYSDVDIFDTINNLDPLNQILVSVDLITQDLTEDINIVLYNLVPVEIPDGNVFHKLNVSIVNSELIDVHIESENFEVVENTVIGNFVPGEPVVLCDIHFQIKHEQVPFHAFSDGFSNLYLTGNSGFVTYNDLLPSGLDLENYEISFHKVNAGHTHRFIRVTIASSEDHTNWLQMPDTVNITAYTVTPYIEAGGVIQSTYAGDGHGGTAIVTDIQYAEILAYKAYNYTPSWAMRQDEASWVYLNSSGENPATGYLSEQGYHLSIGTDANPGEVDRWATIYLWNTTDTSLPLIPSPSTPYIRIQQGAEDILTIQLITPHGDINGTVAADTDNETERHVYNISRNGIEQLHYRVTINPDDIWPADQGALLSYLTFINDVNPTGNGSTDWFSGNVVASSDGSNVMNFYITVQLQPNYSEPRSGEIIISRPDIQNDTNTIDIDLAQKKGFNPEESKPILYLGGDETAVQVGENIYYNLPLIDTDAVFGLNSNKIVEYPSGILYLGIKINEDDLIEGITAEDFGIGLFLLENAQGFTLPSPNVWMATGSWIDVSDAPPELELPYNAYVSLIYTQNTIVPTFNYTNGASRKSIFNITHPLGNILSSSLFTIVQTEKPFIAFDYGETYYEITNDGTINIPIYSSFGQDPVLTLLSVNHYSYPEGNTTPGILSPYVNSLAGSTADAMNGIGGNISTSPTITMNVISGNISPIGEAQFTLDFPSQTDQANYNDYVVYLYIMYPSGTNPFNPGDTEFKLFIIKQYIYSDVQFLSINGLLCSEGPSFNINTVLQNFAGNPSPFIPYLSGASAVSTYFPNVLQVSGFGIDLATDELPDDGTTLIKVDLTKDTNYGLGINTKELLAYNTVSMMLGIDNPTYADISAVNGWYNSTTGDNIIYRIYGQGFSENITLAQHNANFTSSIGLPSVNTAPSQGPDPGVPGFEAALIFTSTVTPPTWTNVGTAPYISRSVDYIDYYITLTRNSANHKVKIRRPYYNYTPATEDFAIFLVAGGGNAVGKAANDNVAWASDVYQYKTTTYTSDATDVTVHEVSGTSAVLDHWDETGNTIGLAKKFVAKLRENNHYANRKILLIPAGDIGSNFGTGNEWEVGNSRYNHCISTCNLLTQHYYSSTFEGVLWSNGETDTSNTGMPLKFFRMVQRMRNDILAATQNTPFISLDVKSVSGNNSFQIGVNYMFNALFCKSGRVSVAGLSSGDIGDGVHWDTNAINDRGEAMYTQWNTNQDTDYDSYAENYRLSDIIQWSYGRVVRQYLFGFDNQMYLDTTNDSQYALTVQTTGSGGSAPSYNTITSGAISDATKAKFSSVILDTSTAGYGLDTGIREDQVAHWTVVFKKPSANAFIIGTLDNEITDYGWGLYWDNNAGALTIVCLDASHEDNFESSIGLAHLPYNSQNEPSSGTVYAANSAFYSGNDWIMASIYVRSGGITVRLSKDGDMTNETYEHTMQCYRFQAFSDGWDNRHTVVLGNGYYNVGTWGDLEVAYLGYGAESVNYVSASWAKWYNNTRTVLNLRELEVL
jgi:hypothetical protein